MLASFGEPLRLPGDVRQSLVRKLFLWLESNKKSFIVAKLSRDNELHYFLEIDSTL
jgi:hypothetical protein